jgi:hypothetical protein
MRCKFNEKTRKKVLVGILLIILMIILYISFINSLCSCKNTIFHVILIVFLMIILLYMGKDMLPEERLFLYIAMILLIYHIISSLYHYCYRFPSILDKLICFNHII